MPTPSSSAERSMPPVQGGEVGQIRLASEDFAGGGKKEKSGNLEEDRPSWEAREWQSGTEDSPTRLWDRLRFDFDLSLADYRQYYTFKNLAELGIGVGAAAPLANTSADSDIRRWYQRRVRSETPDEFADVLNYAGLLWVVLPAGLEGAALAGRAGDGYMLDSGLYEWSNRSLRSIVVGGPPMLLMGAVLGSSRPKGNDSRWHFFHDDNGVSGHAFMGAVPFLTAAAMTENEFVKVPLFLGSFLTAWARINDDRHFFSQVALGWWMAYLAVRRVDDTQADLRSYSITPTFSPDGAGVALQIRY